MNQPLKGEMNASLPIAVGSIAIAIAVSLVTCVVSAFRYVTFDIGPDPDQIRDALVYTNMWDGQFPILGPASSVGGYSLPPLYYYLVFPWTVLGANPALQVLPNAISTLLATVGVAVLTHQLLDNVAPTTRWLLSGLASLWYSLLYGVIFISTFQWNPTPAPLFLILLALLYKVQYETRRSPAVQVLLWGLSGIVAAILVSLHSSTLFVVPVVFGLSSLAFWVRVWRRGDRWQLALPFVSGVTGMVALLPYWRGELDRSFANSKAIVRMVLNSGSEQTQTGVLAELGDRLGKVANTYLDLGYQLYFPLEGGGWATLGWAISTAILILSLGLGLWRFRGNRPLWGFLWLLWGVYFYAASSFDRDTFVFYYKLPILIMPILLVVASLAYLKPQTALHRGFIGVLLAGVFFSCTANLLWDGRYLAAQFGAQRLMSSGDLTQILAQLDEGATVCDPRIERKRNDRNAYAYLSQYVLQKAIQTTSDCQPGHYVVHPKRVFQLPGNLLVTADLQSWEPVRSDRIWPHFTVIENVTLTRATELVLETPTAELLQLQD